MVPRLVFSLILACLGVSAQDKQLAAVRATVLSLRQHPNDHRETRGAIPQLTVVKHQLRDWIEFHLATFDRTGNEKALAEELHAGLRDARLFCDDDSQCFPSSLGFLDETQVSRDDEFLIFQTAVGIWCGYDYSAYVYQWIGSRWLRVWESEQDTYTEKQYLPQIIHAVHISAPDSDGNRLVLTLGSKPGCASAFQPVYYRVWRMNEPRRTSRLLLEQSELANVGGDPPIRGKVGPDDVMVGFEVGGTGYGSSHQAVRHYEVRASTVRQVDPIATTPRDFVEEWLSLPWTQSAARSESPALKEWYVKLHREDGMGDFPEPAAHCTSPDLWQIATHLHESPAMYYLIRWQQLYHFTMIGVSDHPYPDCTERDPKGDEHPVLFPGQN
jgi:hypothetical protein